MFGNAALRGGQTLFHDVHMWGQLVRWMVLGLVLTVVPVPAVSVYRTTTAYEWRILGTGVMAEMKLSLGYPRDSGQLYEWNEGEKKATRIVAIAGDPRIERIRRRLLDTVYSRAWSGFLMGAGGVLLCTLAFWLLGRRLDRTRRVRGAEMASAKELRRRVTPASVRLRESLSRSKRPAPCRIAGIPWPGRTETQHIIVSGTTGSVSTAEPLFFHPCRS